jgi:hypothetical protein
MDPLFIFIHSLFISFSQICLPPVALVFSANFDYVLIIEPKAISERSPDFWNGFFDQSISFQPGVGIGLILLAINR